jgi:ATP/maltotriose-dependent transcriptional regulator MalT
VEFEHVLVVGAGQMGGGIAQVVAASGRSVSLHDPYPGAVERGVAAMRKSLERLAEKGGAPADEVLARVTPADDLVEANLMIEAVVELEAGDAAAAETIAREGYEGLEQLGERGFRSTVACFLAEALYAQGRLDEAEQFAVEAGELATADDFVSQNRSRAVQAKVLAQRGETDRAEKLVREAVEIVARTDSYGEHGEALLDEAEVLRLGGKLDESRSAVESALVLFERKGATSPASRARALLSELPHQAATTENSS